MRAHRHAQAKEAGHGHRHTNTSKRYQLEPKQKKKQNQKPQKAPPRKKLTHTHTTPPQNLTPPQQKTQNSPPPPANKKYQKSPSPLKTQKIKNERTPHKAGPTTPHLPHGRTKPGPSQLCPPSPAGPSSAIWSRTWLAPPSRTPPPPSSSRAAQPGGGEAVRACARPARGLPSPLPPPQRSRDTPAPSNRPPTPRCTHRPARGRGRGDGCLPRTGPNGVRSAPAESQSTSPRSPIAPPLRQQEEAGAGRKSADRDRPPISGRVRSATSGPAGDRTIEKRSAVRVEGGGRVVENEG